MSDEILNKISDKIDKISDDIVEIKVIQAKHDANLENHMQRSDTLESLYKELYGDVEPLKADINKIKGAAKLVGILSGITTFVLGCLKLLGRI